MEKDVQQFQEDLLKSVRQMKRGEAARTTTVRLSPVVKARANVQLNQQEFAKLFGVSVQTIQDWENEHRKPTGAAMTLLRAVENYPEIIKELVGED